MRPDQPNPRARTRAARAWNAALAALVCVCVGVLAGSATGQDLDAQLNETEEKLNKVEQREGVLTTEISEASARIGRLEGQVADLRNQEAVAEAELKQRQA